MSERGEPGEGSEIEDSNNGGNDQGEAGHEESGADEDLDLDGERDAGGDADDDLEDDADGADAGSADGSDQVAARKGNPEYGRLRKERRELREENERLRREADAARQNINRPDPAVAAAERRARLELMTSEERAEFLVNEARQETRNEIAQMRFEQADGRDQTRFDGLCARNPAMAAVADKVEEELAKMRRGGGNAPRETVATYLIGKAALERAAKGGKARQQRQGQERVQRQQAKPGNGGRSDVAKSSDRQGGGNERQQRAKRLDGLNI